MKTRTKQPEQRKRMGNLREDRENFYNASPLYQGLMRMHLEMKDSLAQQRDFGLYYQ